MAKPVIVVVDDEEASRRSLTEELESRYACPSRPGRRMSSSTGR
jgi:hypothetical protein